MSLSRPVKFPLLKLPYLCIDSVVKRCDIFDIIFLTLISKKTRRIVKSFKIPLNFQVYLTFWQIRLGNTNRNWIFKHVSCFVEHNYSRLKDNCFVLQNNPIPLNISRTNDALMSYTHGNTMNAIKMAMEFLKEMFKCSVDRVDINGDNLPESGDIGVKSTVNLNIYSDIYYAKSQKLNSLLESLEVTGTCYFRVLNPEKGFYVDPKLFKSKKLMFFPGSAAWVTREILLQLEVPRLYFCNCPFSVEDIVSFVTNWYHSDNQKFEYLYIGCQYKHISLEQFRHLNPSPFSDSNRVPLVKSFRDIDFSKELEIIRHDGSQATIYINRWVFLFYIWHNQ
ncbi:unnamed protein product [Caenorhabditis brenneri]